MIQKEEKVQRTPIEDESFAKPFSTHLVDYKSFIVIT